MTTKLRGCACGCGRTFDVSATPTKLYAMRQCQLRGPTQAPEYKATREQLTALQKEHAKAAALLDRYSTIKPADMRAPKWLKQKRSGKAHHATPVLMISDLHLDEVVDFYEMDGVNEYNREIAEVRFGRVIDSTVELLKRYVAGVQIDGIVAALVGDIITGEIHRELAVTNEAPPPASIVHWVPLIASGLRYLADELGLVHVPVVDGNHDRTLQKMQYKQRAESSFAWVIYNWLADTLRDDDRITFAISTSPEQLVDVYETTFLLSHGDSFRSQGGVGGLYPALLKWLLRRHQLYTTTQRDFDYALIGHWHQALWGQDFVVNGSLKGYDEYAKGNGFGFERARQQLMLVTPERGVTGRWHVDAE